MLSKIKKSNNEGFTIIEVMIVLAVAALILLIVLLAVPALQRNSRNTALKNDASTVAGGITTWESDNDGSIPTAVYGNGTSATPPGSTPLASHYAAGPDVLICSGILSCESAQVQPTTQVSYESGNANAPAVSGAGAILPGDILVDFASVCAVGTTGTTASSRTIAVYYPIETSGNPIIQCIQI